MTTTTRKPPGARLVQLLAEADPTADPETVAAAAERYAERGRRICSDAAALIRRNGHLQGQLGDWQAGYCITGALILAASGADPDDGRTWAHRFRADESGFAAAATLVRERLDDVIDDADDAEYRSIAEWNDAEGRSATEVLEVLEDVADEREPIR